MSRLIEIVREQLPAIAPSQTRYRVTEIPTERTIRFYTAKGLVDKPIGSAGGRAGYGYRHLLQVLAVKYLQSQYLPLVKVRALMDGVDNRDLEMMIPAIAPATATHRVITREDRRLPGATGPVASDRPPERTPAAPAADGTDAARMDLWHRVEVSPGVELHVHAAALTQDQRERVRGALLRELGVMRGWFGEGEKT